LRLFKEQKPIGIHGLAEPVRVSLGENTQVLPALLAVKSGEPLEADREPEYSEAPKIFRPRCS
jgi:hypothetical protein